MIEPITQPYLHGADVWALEQVKPPAAAAYSPRITVGMSYLHEAGPPNHHDDKVDSDQYSPRISR